MAVVRIGVIDIDQGWKKHKVAVRRLGRMAVKAGVFEKTTAKGGKQVAEYATYLEYGTRFMPERPFMRSAFDKKVGRYFRQMAWLARKAADGNIPFLRPGMKTLAEMVREDIFRQFASSPAWAAPLAPKTVARKGHDIPLVETGTLLGSLKGRVISKKEYDKLVLEEAA
jgi:hypothetical protein